MSTTTLPYLFLGDEDPKGLFKMFTLSLPKKLYLFLTSFHGGHPVISELLSKHMNLFFL